MSVTQIDLDDQALAEVMRIAGRIFASPKLYRLALKLQRLASNGLPRFAIYTMLNPWGHHREVPAPPAQTFNAWYRANRKARDEQS